MKKNIGLLIISFVIALSLYYVVNDKSGMSSMNLMLSVVTSNVPKDKLVISSTASQVQVTVRGPQYLLQKIAEKGNGSFDVRIPEVEEKSYTTKILPNDFKFPSGIEVLNIEPKDITFTLDKVITKELPVIIPRIGSLNEDLKLINYKVFPENVKVAGSEFELSDKKRIEAEPIDMRTITEDTEIVTKLRPLGNFITLKNDTATVKIFVKPVMSSKEFKGVSINLKNDTTKNYILDYKTVDILISGPKNQMEVLEAKDIKPYIKITDSIAKSGNANIELDLPEGITIVSLNPKTVGIKSAGGF